MNKFSFNPLEYPICLASPLWFEETSWGEHIPFGFAITRIAGWGDFRNSGIFMSLKLNRDFR